MKDFLLNILLVITIAGGLVSCNGDNHDEPDKKYSFMFTENPVMAGASGGTVSTMIISDIGYTPVPLDSWITDVKAESSETISFTVAANPEKTSRDGKIAFYITGTEDVKELTVRQAASAGGLKAGKESVEFEVTGGEQEVTVSSPSNWDISGCSEWLTASKKNASAVVISADVNYSGKTQSGQVTISTATDEVVIKVSQATDNSLFAGASTPMGRRFAYNTGDLVTAVTTDKSYSLTEGVDVLEIKYTSKTSGTVQPYYAYIFEVRLDDNVTIAATSKNDDDAEIKSTSAEVTGLQTVREQLAAIQTSRGKTVYGGVNGDFFLGSSDISAESANNLLQGVMYKRGVCLKDSFHDKVCTVFAIMKDGTARILTQSTYSNAKSDIQEAVGGRQEVLSSGVVTSVKNNTYAPRTAVGVSADRNKVILLVVDGRRSSHSNGAEYPELGKMLKAMGAYNGINLDGGGSSTFVVNDGGSFTVKNKPSDDKEREIVNGLAIISK